MKFKIGDEIIIKNDAISAHHAYKTDAQKERGRIGMVSHAEENKYRVRTKSSDTEYYWHESDLEFSTLQREQMLELENEL